jgi:hypothetical protein
MQTLTNSEKRLTPMQYEVIDNYLPQEEFEKIRDIIMGTDFPWYYNPEVTFTGVQNKSMYFTHLFYNASLSNSNFLGLISPLLSKINAKAFIRVKGNMYPNIGSFLSNERHIDYDFNHKGAIFYINTNNGPTILEDGTKIDAVANRILFFDASRLHNSTLCTDQKIRINININYF